ncbi:MAG: hypothetical protein KFH87_00690 [Bacteroidetes bacterium]|nr:hypothetical protein [Bacteroidota bacterium]
MPRNRPVCFFDAREGENTPPEAFVDGDSLLLAPGTERITGDREAF